MVVAKAGKQRVSQTVLALLGGATQQAVSQSGKPRQWLAARIHEALFPEIEGRIPEGIDEVVHERYQGLLVDSYARWENRSYSIPKNLQKGIGRPLEASAEALAAFLGVPVSQDMHSVFVSFVNEIMNVSREFLTPGTLWITLHRDMAEAGYPMYLNSEPCTK